MIPSVLIEHDLFGKPASTFPDHAQRLNTIARFRVTSFDRDVTGARPRHAEESRVVWAEGDAT